MAAPAPPKRAPIVVHDEVATALAEHRPVVALESTIFSRLGLPAPANESALARCKDAVRRSGAVPAVPAVTAVIDGTLHVGLDDAAESRILDSNHKVAERDLAVAVAQQWPVGVTTVSAAVALAHAVGIQVFATGGIGGAHRGSGETGDISADLDALAHHPVVTVCAGAKAFLDLRRTLEYLETAGVPVLGWRHDYFPAFYSRSSGQKVPHRVETAAEVAAVLSNRIRPDTGVLVAAPIPTADEIPRAEIDEVIGETLAAMEGTDVSGAAVTPHILAAIGQRTEGRSIPANLALAENNAEIAGQIATALSAT